MRTYNVELREDFIKDLYKSSNTAWKARIKHLIPEAFKTNFEVGNWYKLRKTSENLPEPKALVNYRGGEHGFGFNSSGLWDESSSWSFVCFPESWRPAADKEVKQSLIKEAKKRGLVEGAKVFSLRGKTWEISTDKYLFTDGRLYSDSGRATIFEDGKWAEPIENPTLKRIEEIEAELKKLKKEL